MMHSPSFLVSDVARRMRYLFDSRTRPLGITRAQWRMLVTIAIREAPSQSELADIIDVERITMCRMIDRMVEAGMVERRADPSDRRVWRIHLTEKAMPLVDRINEIAREFEKDFLAALEPDERTQLVHLLGRVRDSLKSGEEAQRELKKAVGQ